MLKLIGREDLARKLLVVFVVRKNLHAVHATVGAVALTRLDLDLQIVVALGAVLQQQYVTIFGS